MDWESWHTAIVVFTSLVVVGVLTVMLYFLCQHNKKEEEENAAEDTEQVLPCSVRIDPETAKRLEVTESGKLDSTVGGGEMTFRTYASRGESPPGAQQAADRHSQAALIEKQELDFREIYNEYANLVAKWYRHKHRSGNLECAQKLGSLGLAMEGGESGAPYVSSLLISKVHAGSAVSEARLTKKNGDPLPAGEDRLQPGDLLLKITTDATEQSGQRSALYADNSWAVFTQSQVKIAVGPVGDTYAGSKVTLWVVRDKTQKAKWANALKLYCGGGGHTDPHAETPQTIVSEVLSFTDNPLAIDERAFKLSFEIPNEYLLKATFTMQSQAEEAQRMRQTKLEALGWTPESQDGSGRWQEGPGGVNLQAFHEFCNDEDKAKKTMMPQAGIDADQPLTFLEMHKLQANAHESMGLPPPSEEDTKAVFEDADVHGSGSLSFSGLFHWIREEVSDAIMEIEDVGQRYNESPAGHNTPVDGVLGRP